MISLQTCATCRALVLMDEYNAHQEWHRETHTFLHMKPGLFVKAVEEELRKLEEK